MERAKYCLHVKIYPSRSIFYPSRSNFFARVNGPLIEFFEIYFALLCFALLCFALLCFALLCFALLYLLYFIFRFLNKKIFFHVPGYSGMFRNLPECSMFRILSKALKN